MTKFENRVIVELYQQGKKTTRKLASIQRVAEIRPIEGADAIKHFRITYLYIESVDNLDRVV